MRFLIIGRHGHYSREPKDGMGLTDRGRTEVEQLIEAVRRHMHGTVRVVACSEIRIEQSAELIAEAYGAVPIIAEVLRSGTAYEWYEKDWAKIVACIVNLGQEVDTLVVVNSLPLARLLPRDFARQILGAEFPEIKFEREGDMDKEALPTGSAVVIDCVRKSLTLVRRDEVDEVVVAGIVEPEAPAPAKSPPKAQARLPGIEW